MNAQRDRNDGRLAIIAGGGKLPLYVARAAREQGEDPFVIALQGETVVDWSDFPSDTISVGDFAALSRLIKQQGIQRVILSGGVTRRPEAAHIRPTWKFLARLPHVFTTLKAGGDNAVLEMVIGLLEDLGCRVVGAHEVVPGLLANVGQLGQHQPDSEAQRDIEAGIRAALSLGRLDIGQGAVSVGGRVVALEGPEGTDLMLERVAQMRAAGRISTRRKGVLVKLAKPQQDERADLPTIGLSTLQNAVRSGLSGIVAEAGRSLVLDREELIAEADKAGVFILGIAPDALQEDEP